MPIPKHTVARFQKTVTSSGEEIKETAHSHHRPRRGELWALEAAALNTRTSERLAFEILERNVVNLELHTQQGS